MNQLIGYYFFPGPSLAEYPGETLVSSGTVLVHMLLTNEDRSSAKRSTSLVQLTPEIPKKAIIRPNRTRKETKKENEKEKENKTRPLLSSLPSHQSPLKF